MDYTFLRGELTGLIREWIEEERLNAPEVAPSSVPSDLSTRNTIEIKILPNETSEQSSVVEVDEVIATLDPSIAPEIPVTKLS